MSGLAPTQSLSDILVSQSPSDSPSSSPEQPTRNMDVQPESAGETEVEGGDDDKDRVEEGDRDGNGDEDKMEVQRDEQEVESDELAIESESDAGPSQSSPQGRRVKVYELRDASWFDRGTGYCRGVFDETNDLALLVVEPEDAAAAGVEGREPEGEGGFLKDDLLLNARVEKEDIYTRQQDTLIVWTEPGSQLDIAMSFQDAEGCHDIWSFIIEVQRHLNSLPGDSAAPSSSSPLSASPMLGVTTQAAVNHDRPWQLPTLANIRDQEMMLRMQSKSAPGRDRAVEHIISEEYIKHLVGVFEQAEDLESLDDLHALCSVMQTIILFNDNGILEYILQDDVFFGVIGILEYDPEYPSLKASYRQFFSDISKFRQVVEIKDAGIQFKIHQTYRLQYLKEVVLARLLDDPTFGILNGFIFFNQVDIVGHIQSDESLLIELFSRFRNGNEPNEPNAGASLDEKKRDTVMFLHQLMLMGKQIQVPTRLALYRNLLDRGLLSVCEWAFQRHEAQILHAAAEMLTLVVDHDVNAVRGHVLKEEADKRPTLIVEMVQLMTATKNLGLLSQMSDILKTLLETAPEGESFVQKREGPTAESFVTFFYDSCAARLFVPLLELPEITNSNPPVKLSREQATLVQHLVELLSFCVLSHSHRASYFVLSNPVSKKITSLLYLRDKTLRHTALRFVKSCLKTPNHFMHRHYTKNDLLLPLVVLLEEEGGKDNMLSSSCLDVLEAIRKDNIKTIINYLYENYRPRIEVLSQRPFLRPFLALMTQRWEQLNEPPPPPPVIEAESSKAWSRAAEAQEEEYFNASDDEEIGPKPPAEVRPPIKRKRSTPVTPGGPPSKRAAKAAAAAAAAATATTTTTTATVTAAPSLGLDYDDGSDSEGSSGGQSPRLAPKPEGETGPPPITPPEELAEDLGDMAMKMRAKRQREEEEDEGFAGLLVKANALGGGTGKTASARAAGAEAAVEPAGEGGGASTPKKKERSTPLKDAGKRIRLSLGSMGLGKALGGGSGNGK